MTGATVSIGGEVDDELSASLGELLKREDLWLHCQKFIKEQKISCAETVYQTDRVIVNAYEFIEGICGIVGYVASEDDG